MSDDWQVVEEALAFVMERPMRENALSSLARLREREAQLERDKVAVAMEAGLANEDWQRAEARVAELEAALREIAQRDLYDGSELSEDKQIARRALVAHKEETP